MGFLFSPKYVFVKRINHASLKPYNTFGFDVIADELIEFNSEEELISILEKTNSSHKLILGGGSNVCLTKNIDGLVLLNKIQGVEITHKNEDQVTIAFGAGENWHEMVLWTLDNGFGGLENLSLIPGNIGTAPMQNIGAYGVEIKDVFESLEAIDVKSLQKRTFSNDECQFGYRESVFKNIYKDQFIITKVSFNLSARNHKIKADYGDIQKVLEERGITKPTIKDISNAVISIRQSKLPDPKEIGNSGSFFKNPVISKVEFEEVKKNHPNVVAYPFGEEIKVSAGWLIDRAGWKGYREGNVGVHGKQALVLVHYGNGKGREIIDLAQKIIQDIKDKYNITLVPEVNIL